MMDNIADCRKCQVGHVKRNQTGLQQTRSWVGWI